jgi:hypothetical protein
LSSSKFFKKFHGSFFSSIISPHHPPIDNYNIFGDLSLLIKGSSDLESCLDKFTSSTPIQGRYTFEDNMTETANMITQLVKFPEILHIQLNRFDFFGFVGPQ